MLNKRLTLRTIKLRPSKLRPTTFHNSRQHLSARRIFFTLLLMSLLAAGHAAPEPVFSQTREQTTRALLATVQVIMPDDELEEISLGSGTVMDETGLILTNHHVVAGDAPNGLLNSEGITLIAMPPDDLRGESVLRYYGTVVKIDPELDLALIRIDALFDDPDAALPADLGLTAIERGDSNALMIADTINIFGYPGIGGNTPTLTRGLVSGFLDEDRDGIYEWIKTDAILSSGNSGGLATDDRGRFVGVPTAGRFSEVGQQLGLVRSGELALDFVDSYFPATALDQTGITPSALERSVTLPSVTGVQYATAISRRNEPINPALRFEAGVATLYAVFQHQNFVEGEPFAAIWRLDGAPFARDEFLWDGSPNGTNWVSINAIADLHDESAIETATESTTEAPTESTTESTLESTGPLPAAPATELPTGFLELELLFDNRSIYRGGVTIGAANGLDDALREEVTPTTREQAQTTASTFGAITFAENIIGRTPIRAATVFSGLQSVYAVFDYANMAPDASWNTRWYLNGNQVLEQFALWDGGQSGVYYVTLTHPSGLPTGQYRLELYIEGQLAQSGEFQIDPPAEAVARQVGVTGLLVDRDNRRRLIHGALVMALTPGTSAQGWLANGMPNEAVFARGTSNRQGTFRLDSRLIVGEQYPIVVMHEHYRTIAIESYLIPNDAGDPHRLDFELQRN